MTVTPDDGRQAAPSTPATPDRPRQMGFSDAGEFRCPRGHHVSLDAPLGEWGYVTCRHRELHGHDVTGAPILSPECNARLLVIVFARRAGRPPMTWCAEVAWPEVLYMEQQEMDAEAMLAFLGGRYTPPKLPTKSDRRVRRPLPGAGASHGSAVGTSGTDSSPSLGQSLGRRRAVAG